MTQALSLNGIVIQQSSFMDTKCSIFFVAYKNTQIINTLFTVNTTYTQNVFCYYLFIYNIK